MNALGTTNALGASNPEYVTARVRARRAALFEEDDYRKLVRMGPSGIARFMEESEYETEINRLGARHSGVDLIEYALHENLAKHFHDLLAWSEGKLHELIARYLRRYDAWNVKTVIRGVYTDATYEEIEPDLIIAGELTANQLESMANAETIRDVIDQLSGTQYYDPLVEAFETYEEEAVLVPLENAIDRAIYSHLLDGIRTTEPIEGPLAMYVEFLQAEIDFRNLRNAFRVAHSGADVDPGAFFIEGGNLFTRSSLAGLVTNRDELVEAVRSSTYADELSDALEGVAEADSLIQFEHALEAVLLAYTERLANVYPVSVTAVMSYVLAKEREVDNIRAIARGKESGLAESEIERELIVT